MPLEFGRAAVASTNPAKVGAVRRTLAVLAPNCEITAIDAPHGLGAQPLGDAATRAGARWRAKSALRATGADVAFGLEGGVILSRKGLWLCSWVAALGRDGREGEASGLRMELPPRLADGIRAGRELGDLIDELFGVTDAKGESGAIGLLTDGVVSRTDAFADLVAMSLAPFLRPTLY